jgi:hypothetical protein
MACLTAAAGSVPDSSADRIVRYSHRAVGESSSPSRIPQVSASADCTAARLMARLPLSHPDREVVNCPMDDGSAEVLALAYPGRPDVDLWIRLNGCRGVSNGYITAGGL